MSFLTRTSLTVCSPKTIKREGQFNYEAFDEVSNIDRNDNVMSIINYYKLNKFKKKLHSQKKKKVRYKTEFY